MEHGVSDKDNRRVTMSYKTNNDCPDGNHV